jgi:phospholipid/cholesterol/gamma-HCH transport system permease protein
MGKEKRAMISKPRVERVFSKVLLPAGSFIIDVLALLGRFSLGCFGGIGRFFIFFGQALWRGMLPPYYLPQLRRQLLEIGYFSLPVVGLTALFTGMVLALQSYTGFSRFHGESAIATVVVLSMTRELGPVLGGLMVAGRVGASMAAEIGTMRVTEQVDALTTLSTDPMKYLVFPRILAALITLPLLVFIADIIGVLGGYIIGVYRIGFISSTYLSQTAEFLKWSDVFSGLFKAACFGVIIAGAGCYQGYHSRGGAQGVGSAATRAVVMASIAILLANYGLTALFFEK